MPDESTQSTAGPHTGPFLAAILGACLGLLILSIVQVACFLSPDFQARVFNLGKAWIPNADAIGPYSGKETLMVVGWLFSWALLHMGWRRRDLHFRTWFGVSLAVLFAATVLIWPPVWHLLK